MSLKKCLEAPAGRPLRAILNMYVKPGRRSLARELVGFLIMVALSFFPAKLAVAISAGEFAQRRQIRNGGDWIILSEIVGKRREGKTGHEVADLEVRKLLDTQGVGMQWDSASWFKAAKMSQSVGLFGISLEFHRRGLAKFGLEVGRLRGIRKSLGLAQLAIQTGDSNLAGKCKSQLSSHPLTSLARSAKAVLEYLEVWLDGESGGCLEFVHPPETLFSSFVKGRNVHLIGPAVLRESKSWGKTNPVIVGIMRVTGPTRVSAGNFEFGVPKLAYANGNTADFLSKLDEASISDVFEEFSAVVFKTPIPAALRRTSDRPIRSVRGGNQLLFIYGRPNMVHVATLDILGFAPSGLFISGVDFFIGGYREDERWYDHVRQKKVDTLNSGGEVFEVCASISEHGAIENRNLMKNLVMHKRLDGDASFRESLLLTDEEYLRALEIRFGRDRV